MKFDEIVGQLADIARKENIEADDEALAILAEAGDGSVRDALSIMDQAIAGSGTKLSGEQVRGLVGSVGSEALEELMAAVARSSSEEALRLLDKLMTEGHNPAHFAKQLVRLLRNAVVAKVAGDNSPLLQISSDERARAGRVAEQFSEEDLARFLQIMLRTYDELGYRQEQRFHLELGVLKLVHAQRILPLEQILSQVASEPPKTSAGIRQAAPAPAVLPASGAAVRKQEISPFDADRARKDRSSGPEMADTVKMQSQAAATATAVAVESDAEPEFADAARKILGCVIVELRNHGSENLASILERGNSVLAGNELTVAVAARASVIRFLMNSEEKQVANSAASAAAGRPLKVNLIDGGATQTNGAAVVRPQSNGTSARSRAVEDPVIQRMQEKFGAEIRTVIDHRDKS